MVSQMKADRGPGPSLPWKEWTNSYSILVNNTVEISRPQVMLNRVQHLA